MSRATFIYKQRFVFSLSINIFFFLQFCKKVLNLIYIYKTLCVSLRKLGSGVLYIAHRRVVMWQIFAWILYKYIEWCIVRDTNKCAIVCVWQNSRERHQSSIYDAVAFILPYTSRRLARTSSVILCIVEGKFANAHIRDMRNQPPLRQSFTLIIDSLCLITFTKNKKVIFFINNCCYYIVIAMSCNFFVINNKYLRWKSLKTCFIYNYEILSNKKIYLNIVKVFNYVFKYTSKIVIARHNKIAYRAIFFSSPPRDRVKTLALRVRIIRFNAVENARATRTTR